MTVPVLLQFSGVPGFRAARFFTEWRIDLRHLRPFPFGRVSPGYSTAPEHFITSCPVRDRFLSE